jgi:hypothetical protein
MAPPCKSPSAISYVEVLDLYFVDLWFFFSLSNKPRSSGFITITTAQAFDHFQIPSCPSQGPNTVNTGIDKPVHHGFAEKNH